MVHTSQVLDVLEKFDDANSWQASCNSFALPAPHLLANSRISAVAITVASPPERLRCAAQLDSGILKKEKTNGTEKHNFQ